MDQAIRAAEAGKGTKEGPSPQLSYQLDKEKAEKADGGYQANYQQRREQTYVVPNQTDSEEPSQSKCPKGSESH